jgi:hypothetical protein
MDRIAIDTFRQENSLSMEIQSEPDEGELMMSLIDTPE